MSRLNGKVQETTHIKFDENHKTFRLFSGNTMYAFCIGPELGLEHLYWGEQLDLSYDLRYLSQSCRNAHFATVEACPLNFDGKIKLQAETLEEIQKTWRDSKKPSVRPETETDISALQRRRLENYSWRIMSKATQPSSNVLSSSYHCLSTPRRADKSMKSPKTSVSLDLHQPSESKIGRRRSSSTDLYNMHEAEAEKHTESTPALEFTPLRAVTFAPTPTFTPAPSNFRLPRRKATHHHSFDRSLGKLGKGALCCEYADYGTGDYRTPSFITIDNSNGSSISPLRYRRHAIYRGKLPMPDALPAIRCLSDQEASTLVVTMADTNTGLEVDLIYVSMHEYDVITRRAVFRNVDTRRCTGNDVNICDLTSPVGNSKVLQKASSVSLDFEATASPFHLVKLSGSWGRERYVAETKLTSGMQSFGSTRGVSGHVHNPFAAITLGAPSETCGEVRGFSFIYSGNFLVEAEMSENGRLRVNVGLHPMGLQWHLMPTCEFNTPEVVLTRSSDGLSGMSRALHRLFLDRLLPRNWSDAEPPVLLNSWEAKYFHVNHHNIVDMAVQASKVGINLIVLDDGWFGRRSDDTRSLGDWVADITKFPHGIKGLAEEVNAAGCKFGIWFEPEMVSEDSLLHASHPDWYLHVPGRPRQLSRNQMVLDLSRAEVVDYLYCSLAAVLSSANIEYVKWDMNRPLTEVYSAAVNMGDVWQAEISHRYMLGVYELQQRIVTAFPPILLENCASGGGRYDPGMLYYSPQIWCSDNTDALTRMKIQYGTSLAYPTRCIGAHISTVPNHITGSTTRLRTRAFVAMCGTFGFELDISTATDKDLGEFKKHIELYKQQVAPIVRWGDMYRLWSPFKLDLAAWMYVSRDKAQAVVFAFSLNSDHWSNLVPRLQLQGLLPDAEYVVSEPQPNNVTQASGNLMIVETAVPAYQLAVNNVCLTGRILMSAGLPVKFYTLDDSLMFLLTMVTPSMETTPCDSPSYSPAVTPRATAPATTPRHGQGLSPFTNTPRNSTKSTILPHSTPSTSPLQQFQPLQPLQSTLTNNTATPTRSMPPSLPPMPRLDRAASTSDIDNDRAKIPGISSAGIMGGRVHRMVKSPSMNLQVFEEESTEPSTPKSPRGTQHHSSHITEQDHTSNTSNTSSPVAASTSSVRAHSAEPPERPPAAELLQKLSL